MTTMFNYCMIDINIKDSIFKYKEIMKYKNKKMYESTKFIPLIRFDDLIYL
jgi:hypothetical protein